MPWYLVKPRDSFTFISLLVLIYSLAHFLKVNFLVPPTLRD
jgi:hypothetical protein